MDQLILRGHYPLRPPLPAVPGAEGCVEIVEVGPDCGAWSVGDHALLPIRAGAWRSTWVCETEGLYRLPAGLDPVQASMLRVNGATALALVEGVSAGEWIVQSLGSGGVGQAVIQLARARGVRTASVVRGARWVEPLTRLGADRVVSADEQGFPKKLHHQLRDLDGPVVRALDGLGGDATASLARACGRGATIFHYGAMSKQGPQVGVADLIFRGVRLEGFWLYALNQARGPEREREALDTLCASPPRFAVDSCWPLAAWRDALARAAHPECRGRVVFAAEQIATSERV